MIYQEVLDWMFAQLPMYQQKGISAYSGKLEGITKFTTHLNNPEKKFKSIHVAGTNGKGSSSHMLASILQEAGYKVGLYTSPHLKDFRERIKINGTTISEREVIDFIESNFDYLTESKLSFFEMTVGMAFDYFVTQNVDIAVIEVGLGGRLDSTNIIIPEISLITNIGLDHVEMLGDTLAKIAVEKAGIIKNGIPVVVSETQEETQDVFKAIAASKNSEISFADQVVGETYKTTLLGDYQEKNVKGVLEVVSKLDGFTISSEAIKHGLLKVVENTGLLGRWQTIAEHPKVICDTAHNSDGLKIVVTQLLKQQYEQLHMVIGFVKDKDLDVILPLLPKTANYYFCAPAISRGLDENILKNKAREYQLEGNSYSSVNKALESALSKASSKDFVYVGGSTFVVAEIL
jgi:dihydrofolate synthase/folylpolyglutamate synthase